LRNLGKNASLRGAPLAVLCLICATACTVLRDPIRTPEEHALVGPRSFLSGYPSTNADGTVNVVVEIPAGTTAKWEVDKQDGVLRWELEHGNPRVVQYLGYPGNYGMVPRTLLPSELGGDGDPLDVIVLGPAVARGSVLRVHILGVLRLLDGGEQDDKLLAVQEGTALAAARDLDELNLRFPGVTLIVETWFRHYKGPGRLEPLGFGSADSARAILDAAAAAFESPEGRRDE
jgi:inorganic pyrophosphatase